jgi:hypothetical protein
MQQYCSTNIVTTDLLVFGTIVLILLLYPPPVPGPIPLPLLNSSCSTGKSLFALYVLDQPVAAPPRPWAVRAGQPMAARRMRSYICRRARRSRRHPHALCRRRAGRRRRPAAAAFARSGQSGGSRAAGTPASPASVATSRRSTKLSMYRILRSTTTTAIRPAPCTVTTSTSYIFLDSEETRPVCSINQHDPMWNDTRKLQHRSERADSLDELRADS